MDPGARVASTGLHGDGCDRCLGQEIRCADGAARRAL